MTTTTTFRAIDVRDVIIQLDDVKETGHVRVEYYDELGNSRRSADFRATMTGLRMLSDDLMRATRGQSVEFANRFASRYDDAMASGTRIHRHERVPQRLEGDHTEAPGEKWNYSSPRHLPNGALRFGKSSCIQESDELTDVDDDE